MRSIGSPGEGSDGGIEDARRGMVLVLPDMSIGPENGLRGAESSIRFIMTRKLDVQDEEVVEGSSSRQYVPITQTSERSSRQLHPTRSQDEHLAARTCSRPTGGDCGGEVGATEGTNGEPSKSFVMA